ncbi:NAD(P)-dependent oxidoreductase [Naasia lichenicola]|uniref:NAD-dependent epimerase n=1 Tax=Naasia lichenicola TaxID=2565933 RepID=A0A4S4FNP7_9MICO|nr:NAD(P)H-binding protein [Naasia lichenicola]THG31858.1 NAD-dependent epimerase [Naasia lichenicola]
MTQIVLLGGTGYTGANIAAEAVSRGHSVISWSRTLPESPIDGVSYETGSLLDPAVLRRAISGADVVIGTLSPRGELAGKQRMLYGSIAEQLAGTGTRWGVVGGFSSLRPAEGAARFADSGEVPAEYLQEAQELSGVADDLGSSPDDLDWFFLSPAAVYGSYVPGEKLGRYRVGGEVAIFDEKGESVISGADYATAVIDEIETPAHHRAQFGVAY